MASSKSVPAEGSAGKPGKRRLLLIIVGGLVLLLAGGGAGAYFLLFSGPTASAHAAAPEPAHDGEADAHAGKETEDLAGEAAAEPVATFVDLPDLLVNLQPDGKRMRFLRLRVALEVPNEKIATGVKALTPRVLDSFQMYLRALSVEDVQGAAGMLRLKEEMLARANLAIEPARIRDILFKEILVQ